MTKEEILLLPSGGRLSMLVAETLFDWKKITDVAELDRLNTGLLHAATGGWWISGSGERRYYAPSYSVNMSEAWRVVEALQEYEFWMRTVSGKNGKWEPSATVEVGKLPDTLGNPSKQIASLSGLPVPEMICKMALVAVLGL